ncbi:putative bifunctional diguanylate cyclase/phosphodiesterase [Arhodomonas sp. SL1]|uniref:putative bifunctional diguanylate cyclase/phosphodiesterase n=1 Tax=Arhodomonas sp. SL1 TaxID=3425691 RepID=UPI003F882B51
MLLDDRGRVEALLAEPPRALQGLAPGERIDAWLIDVALPSRPLSGCLPSLRSGCSAVYLTLCCVADPSHRFAARVIPLAGGAMALELEPDPQGGGASSKPRLDRADFIAGLEAAAASGDPVAVGCVDIDRLRQINLGYGHGCGDMVVAEVGRRLVELAGDEDLVARLGGDEFGVLLRGPATLERAEAMAESLDQTMRRPIICQGEELVVTVSAGFSAPCVPRAPEAPLAAAEAALQRARGLGRSWILFEHDGADSPDPRSARAVALELGLHRALAADEFSLLYQPIIDLDSGALVGVEALLRWSWDQNDNIPPDQFVPVLEDTGLIRPVGAWVLRRACQEVAAAGDAPGSAPELSVNVSVEQLYDPAFVDTVAAALQDAGLAPERLTLELTEHRLIGHSAAVGETLARLRRLGVSLAIDDFGTGYSSLAYLRELPVQALKVDRSFVQGLWQDEAGPIIMHSIVSMARELGLLVVVEGIESTEEARFLERWPGLLAQGYLYGRPAPMAELVTR